MKKNLNARNYFLSLIISVMLIISMSLPMIVVAESPILNDEEIVIETTTSQEENTTVTVDETTITSDNDLSVEPTTETSIETTSAQAVDAISLINKNQENGDLFTKEKYPDLWASTGHHADYDQDGILDSEEMGDIIGVAWSCGDDPADAAHVSLNGIRLLYNVSYIEINNSILSNVDQIQKLPLKDMLITNCRLTSLPDLTNCNTLENVCLDGNKLSLKEISTKLPAKFASQFLEIARQQHPDPFEQTITSNGVTLSGVMLPDVNFSAMSKGESFDVTVSRLEETYVPENVTLSVTIPEGKEITSVVYNGRSVNFKVVDKMVVIPFNGDGLYSYSVKEVETTTEPTTAETTTEEPTTIEPTTTETTTVEESTTQEETTTKIKTTTTEGTTSDNPKTGDSNGLSSVAIIAILSVFVMLFTVTFKRKKVR